MITNPKGLLTILFTLQYSELVKRFQYQGKVKLYNEIDYNSLVAYAAKATNINESNIRMSMDAIFDAVQYFVTEGHGVELEGLGTFSFGIKCKAAFSESAAQSQLDGLRQKFINFLPALEIRKAMNGAKLVKEVDDRNNPETNIVLVNRASYYPDGNRSHKAYPIADNTQEVLISNGALLRLEGANFKRGITSSLVVGADGASALLMRATFKDQTPNIEQYYVVGGVEGNLPIKNLRVVDKEGAEKFNFNGYINNGDSVIRSVDYGTARLLTGLNTIAMQSGETHSLVVRGNNLQDVVVTLNEKLLIPNRLGAEFLQFVVGISTGDTLAVGANSYTFEFTGNDPAINTITANGVTIQNHDTSTIVVGQNYHFVITGSNFEKLMASDISGPAGTVIGNFVKSPNSAEFDARFAEGGDLSIGANFVITLSTKVRTIKLDVAPGGVVEIPYASAGWYSKDFNVLQGTPNVQKFFVRPKGENVPPTKLEGQGVDITYNAESKKLTFRISGEWTSLFDRGEGGMGEILYVPESGDTDYQFFAKMVS